jgi:hypothetical protein
MKWKTQTKPTKLQIPPHYYFLCFLPKKEIDLASCAGEREIGGEAEGEEERSWPTTGTMKSSASRLDPMRSIPSNPGPRLRLGLGLGLGDDVAVGVEGIE